MSLYAKLHEIAERVIAQRNKMTKEAVTRSVSVMPFLRALGHEAEDTRQILEEFDADPKWSGGKTVDYAILSNDQPVILVEAKSATVSLGATHWEQLYQYFNATDARYGVLTNGLRYEFYTDRVKTNIMDRQPFLTIDLLDLDELAIAELRPFTRASFPKEVRNDDCEPRERPELDSFEYPIHANFKGRRLEGMLVVDRVMNWHKQLILVRFKGELMAHTESKSKAIQSIDANAKSSVSAWTFWRFIHPISGEDLPIREICLDVQRNGDLRQRLWKCVSRRANDDAIPIFGCHKGRTFEAELLRDQLQRKLWGASNCVVYKGQAMTAGQAALQALRSVDPQYENSGAQLNGLRFWRVVDPADGRERKLIEMSGHVEDSDDGLRMRLLDKT